MPQATDILMRGRKDRFGPKHCNVCVCAHMCVFVCECDAWDANYKLPISPVPL